MKNVACRAWRINAWSLSFTRIKSTQPLATYLQFCRVLDLTLRHIFAPHAFDVLLHCGRVHTFCIWRENNEYVDSVESLLLFHAVILTFFNSSSIFAWP